MTLGERIKKVRKALDLTQREFGERIAMKQNSVAQIEMGRSTSDQTIFAICKTFNVDEHWLRTGEGGDAAMFVELPKNEALAAQIQNFLQGGTDSFRERLVSLLLRLSPEQWEVLEGYLLELTTPQKALQVLDFAHTPTIEEEARAEAEEYYRQRLMEKKQEAALSALPSDTDKEKPTTENGGGESGNDVG